MSTREIKCRALDYTGNWVYGAYIYDSVHKKHFIISCGMHGLTERSVRPETVGQYVGLKDKNGMEIYEGDIIRIYPINTKYYGNSSDFIIKIETEHFGVEAHWNHIMGSGCECPTYIMEDEINYEVIGNRIQSPELLEKR